MTRVVIKELIWDEKNLEHIKKHYVVREEVEKAGLYLIYHKKAKKGRYLFIGRSGKRLLSVVINRKEIGKYYVVTARDVSKKERRIVYEKEKRK